MTGMLAPYRDLLDRLRWDPQEWQRLDHQPGGTHGDGRDDPARTRYGVLLCLQYSRCEEDHALLRHTFLQEIRAREEDPDQGLTPALEVGAFLLARFRRPDDLPLFLRAKLANFDTCCGLDHQYLYLCGAEALRHCRESLEDPQRTAALEVLDEHYPAPDAASMEQWWHDKQHEFPEQETGESPLTMANRALEFDAWEEGRSWLDRWETEQPRTEQVLFTVAHLRERLGQPEQALAAAEARAELLRAEPFQHASALLATVPPLLQLQRFAAARDTLLALGETLRRHPDMRVVGLGRMIAERMLDTALAPGCPPEMGAELLALSDALWHEGVSPTLNALEKAERAARLLGQNGSAAHYRALSQAERERINQELSRVRGG